MVIMVDASDFFPEDPKENHYKQRLLMQNLLLRPDGCSSPPDTQSTTGNWNIHFHVSFVLWRCRIYVLLSLA